MVGPTWTKGTIIERSGLVSFKIQLEGERIIRRHEDHVRRCLEATSDRQLETFEGRRQADNTVPLRQELGEASAVLLAEPVEHSQREPDRHTLQGTAPVSSTDQTEQDQETAMSRPQSQPTEKEVPSVVSQDEQTQGPRRSGRTVRPPNILDL